MSDEALYNLKSIELIYNQHIKTLRERNEQLSEVVEILLKTIYNIISEKTNEQTTD